MGSNQKFNRDYKKLWIMILAVSIITILVAYGFGVIFSNLSNFPSVGTQDGWLSLFGALGGGAMTLFGVFWTINDQNKNRKEELYLQYRPLLVPNISIIEENDYYLTINLQLYNRGRAEAYDIQIYSDSKKFILSSTNNVSLIEKDGYKDFVIHLSEETKKDSPLLPLKGAYTAQFHVTYYDIFKKSSSKEYSADFKATATIIDKRHSIKIDWIDHKYQTKGNIFLI